MVKLKWNKEYIPQHPFTTQISFLMLPHKEAFYGGAAGGGKSSVLLMAALQYVDIPGYAALILRRSLTELKQPAALLDRASQWLSNTRAVFRGDEHTYEFPTKWPDGSPAPPAKLQFGFLGDYNVETRYQGAEYQFVGIDEVTHFENDTAYRYLFSRIRKNVCPKHKLAKTAEGLMEPNYVPNCKICQIYKSLPLRFRCAGNPGGVGHRWVKDRFQITKEIITLGDGTKTVRWVGGDKNKPFIPSKLTDNEYIDQSGYRDSLQNLGEVTRQQLEEGDWDISAESRFNVMSARFYTGRGDYFQLGSRVYHLDDLKKVFITVDPAASTAEGMIDADTNPKKGPSHTVISVWGLTDDYNLIWIHMKRFREEIPYVINQVLDSYKRFSAKYVLMESNGIGKGPCQILSSKGVKLYENKKNRDKIQNAANAIFRMKHNRVWFPESAPWLKVCMDEVFAWSGHPNMSDDVVDTLSDACNDVTWDAYGKDAIMLDETQDLMPSSNPMLLQFPASHFRNRI